MVRECFLEKLHKDRAFVKRFVLVLERGDQTAWIEIEK